MARIALITGGDSFAREVFLHEGRGYWSQALPLALEKHGVLGLEVLAADALERRDELDRFDAVLVARLPPHAWTAEIAAALASGRVPLLVEGPLAPPCAELLGVQREGTVDGRGWLTPTTEALKDLTTAYGVSPYGEVRHAIGRPLPRPPELEWSTLDVPISAAQAAAWERPGWDFERWRLTGDSTPIVEWVSAEDRGDRFPAIVRRDSLMGCSLSLYAYLGQAHTSEPFPPGEDRTSPRSTGLEAILLALIDEMHARRGATRARVMPWPHPARWARSVRHDFDRPLSAGRTRRMLEGHRKVGSAATWYWRARHADAESLRLVAAEPRHEIALHTERPWAGAEAEREAIERAAGVELRGSSAHGAADCFRYQGAPNVIWAEQQGFRYTELLQHPNLHPHRFAVLESDGSVRALRIICLPHHESFDRSTRSNETFAEAIDRALPLWMACGGLCQVMNHPDLNREELIEYLASMPVEGRLDLTAFEAADWWSRTHVSGELTLRALGAGRFQVASRSAVRGISVELLQPDGGRFELTLDLEPGRPAVASREGVVSRWEAISQSFGEAIREYHERRGAPPDAPNVRSTVRTNTELVPKRGDKLLGLLTEMTGTGLEGRRVLELGCGFGALATYLAWSAAPSEIVAADLRADFVEAARRSTAPLGLDDRLRFVQADMRSLAPAVGEEPFDLIVANNSFIYLPTTADADRALREFHRVLAPGGRVLFYHANKWRLREPFTGAPIVHLLPRGAAAAADRLLGWRHSHGRVRLLSPLELRRRLKRAGFSDAKVVGFGRERRTRGAKRFFGSFYALSARRST